MGGKNGDNWLLLGARKRYQGTADKYRLSYQRVYPVYKVLFPLQELDKICTATRLNGR
ncbi:hypothetical protein [Virgibacillus pantothenticus]|uniref:hypothetical protein n=1 Tax=Virgibacillus pantothenticus TaxID=1473 RepID=UPI001BB0992E|nr:hypothetical protein [Virgibacillus pantothenticus]